MLYRSALAAARADRIAVRGSISRIGSCLGRWSIYRARSGYPRAEESDHGIGYRWQLLARLVVCNAVGHASSCANDRTGRKHCTATDHDRRRWAVAAALRQ